MPRLQNGNAVGYWVGDAFLSYSVAKRSTDGTLATHCVTSAEAADKLLKAPQSSTAKLDEEHGDAQ